MLHVRLTWKMQDRTDRKQYVLCLHRGVCLAVSAFGNIHGSVYLKRVSYTVCKLYFNLALKIRIFSNTVHMKGFSSVRFGIIFHYTLQ